MQTGKPLSGVASQVTSTTLSFMTLALLIVNIPSFGAWVNVTDTLAGTPSACGGVYSITAVPTQNKVIIGVCGDKGLFTTTDNGTSWHPMGTSTEWQNPVAILFDKNDPNTFWECGIWGSRIHKTTDGGKTFSILGESSALTSQNDGVAVDMTDPQRLTMVAGCHENSAVSKSTDGGNTWVDITSGLTVWTDWPIVINSQIYLIGCLKDGIYRTVNGGANWTKVSSYLPCWNPLIASDGSIYWTASGNQAILRSTDQGVTWASINKPGNGQANYYTPVEMPDKTIVAIGQTTLVQTSDRTTWTPICATMPTPSGLTQGNLTYNSVAGSFFISLWDCSTAVPAQAIWKHDFGTTSVGQIDGASSARLALESSKLKVVINSRISIIRGNATAAFDLYGRKLRLPQ